MTRRFIVTEGISEFYGDILNLPRLIELKKKYKYRLILDESWSFGVLGSNGRGVTEYFGIAPSEIDMIIGSMSSTLCGGGGFCAGSKEVVDHQVPKRSPPSSSKGNRSLFALGRESRRCPMCIAHRYPRSSPSQRPNQYPSSKRKREKTNLSCYKRIRISSGPFSIDQSMSRPRVI